MSDRNLSVPYIDLFQERPVLRRIFVALAAVGIFGIAILPHAPRAPDAESVPIALAQVHPPFTRVAWHPGAQAVAQALAGAPRP